MLCVFCHCTQFSFAEVIVYLIFCYRSATTSSPPPREQTEGARNLSASGMEATPPRSPTPDQTSQVRANYRVLKIHSVYRFFLKMGGGLGYQQSTTPCTHSLLATVHEFNLILELRVHARKGVAPL